MAFLFSLFKRLFIWSIISVPIGFLLGAFIFFLKSNTSDFFRTNDIFYGALLGSSLALFGSFSAVVTLILGKTWIEKTKGSEKLSGAIVCYGIVILGLLLINIQG